MRRALVWIALALGALGCLLAARPVAEAPSPAPSPRAAAPAPVASASAAVPGSSWLPIQRILDATLPGERGEAALADLRANWRDAYAVILLELRRFAPPASRALIPDLLRELSGQRWPNREAWFQWIWRRDPGLHPNYDQFKSWLYASQVDPSFQDYFADRASLIRLDEVRWGGVKRDGIPPLRQPATIPAAEASWLADEHLVFGVEVDGVARAYPKRILAWHEMVVDTLGEVPITGVYCTLCGSMIVYRSIHAGVHHRLGTSGFLYRSNKLMYDQATRSLWSTLRGEPVIGPLTGRGVRLEVGSCVTTTWGEWRRRHPETSVLSLDTGHERDYGEGIAYRDYFAHDALMFSVLPPEGPARLKNKAEVFVPRFAEARARPVAFASAWLGERPVYLGEHAGVAFVILSDASGAHRLYRRRAGQALRLDEAGALRDSEGRRWVADEQALRAEGQEPLERLPAHRAFWFGWRAAHPDTELIGAE